MIKKILFLCLGIMFLSFSMLQTVSAQEQIVASKRHITRMVEVSSFDHIKLNGSCDIVFTPTMGRSQLKLTLPDNMLDVVQVYVKDRTLVLEMKSSMSVVMQGNARVELQVAAPMVESVTVNGLGNIRFPSHVETKKSLDLKVNGAGEIDTRNIKVTALTAVVNGLGEINLGKITAEFVHTKVNGGGDLNATIHYAKRINADLNGCGDLSLAGSSEEANYVLMGSGDISAKGLKAKKVTAKVLGLGEVKCYASESIVMTQRRDANSICYKGNPKHVVNKNK